MGKFLLFCTFLVSDAVKGEADEYFLKKVVNGIERHIFEESTNKGFMPKFSFLFKNVKKLLETIKSGKLTVGNHWKTLN